MNKQQRTKVAIPFVGHQGTWNGETWNKPSELAKPIPLFAHFVSVLFCTFALLTSSFLFGAFLGDVSLDPAPFNVGARAILAGVAHSFVLYLVFETNASSKLDIRVNPYISLADCFLHQMIGIGPCLLELVAQALGTVAASGLVYGLLNNTPALLVGVGGTLVNTSVGWALGIGIFSTALFSFTYFHNYGNGKRFARAVGLAVILAFPFKGTTTENPFRWLGACVIEGTCGNSGGWIYPIGPLIGIPLGYVIHLLTYRYE